MRPKPEEIRIVLAERVRECRKSRGLTQGQLAKFVGVTLAQISHVETGRFLPYLDFFYSLCDSLGVSADYLLGRTDA